MSIKQISPKYLDPSKLVLWISSDSIQSITPSSSEENPSSFAIIDVRDIEEFKGGHIKGAKHYPSEMWNNREFVHQFSRQFTPKDYKALVFHCQKSQVRGPTCAKIYANHLSQVMKEGENQDV